MPSSAQTPRADSFAPSRERSRLLLLLIGSLLLFGAGIGMRSLWNPNEPVYAEGAREMLQRGSYFLPYVNGVIYSDKPIFYFWTMLAGCLLTGGLSEAGLRIPSLVSGVLSVLLVYRLGRRIFGIRAGFLAGACLATTTMFWWHSQYIQMDQLLSFLMLAALAAFFEGKETSGALRPLLWAASGACMGLAFLTKGPIGLVLPAAIMGLYLLLAGELRWLFRREVVWMGALFLVFAVPWFAGLALTGHREVLEDFFIRHNFERATDPFNHRQPFWYYGPRLLSDLFPWSIFLPAALFVSVRNEMERRGRLFLRLWLGVILVAFSCVGSKRGVYLLPLYPAAALAMGKFWDDVFADRAVTWMKKWARLGLGFLGICLGVMALAGFGGALYGLHSGIYGREAIWLLPAGAIVLAGGIMLWRAWRARRLPEAAVAAGLTMGAVFLYAGLFLFPLADRFKSPAPFSRQVLAVVPPEEEIRSYGLWRWDAAYIFYTGRLMPVLRSPDEVEAYLSQERRVFLLVESSEMDRFLSSLKAPSRLVLRQDIGHKTTALLTNQDGPPS